MSHCDKVTYNVNVVGAADLVGQAHPFAPWLEDAAFELRLTSDGETTTITDSRNPGTVGAVRSGSRDLRLLDLERESFVDTPRALKPLGDGRDIAFERVRETTADVGEARCDAVVYTAPLWRTELRVTVARDPPVSASVAEAARMALVPLDVPAVGLPVEIQVKGSDADEARVHLGLAGVEETDAEGLDPTTAEWGRATAESLLDADLRLEDVFQTRTDAETESLSMGMEAFDAEGLVPSEQPGTATRPMALTGSYDPDAAWLVTDSYLEELRSVVNTALQSFRSFVVDLSGDEIIWWSRLMASIDSDDDRVRLLREVSLLLMTTDGFGTGNLPPWVRHLLSEADLDLDTPTETEYEDNRKHIEKGNYDEVGTMPGPLSDIWQTVKVIYGKPPDALADWFALMAAVNATADDFDAEMAAIADDVWWDLLRAMGSEPKNGPEMPGEPVSISLPEGDRSFFKTVKPSDLSTDVDIPGWISNLAKVNVTATEATLVLPREKLSKLAVGTRGRPNGPDVPVLDGELAVDEIQVEFTYNSRPAFSVGSVVGWVATGGALAALVTAAGNGTLTMENVNLPFHGQPTTADGGVGYDLTPKDPTVGTIDARLANYVPTSLPTTMVLDVWLSNAEGLASDLLGEILDEAGLFDDPLEPPFAWPDSWRLREPPGEEPLGAEEIALQPTHDSYARGRDLAVDAGRYITVDRADGDDTTRYALSAGAGTAVDPGQFAGTDAGYVLSGRYLEAWLLRRVGLLSEYADWSLDTFLDDAEVDLPPLQRQVSAVDLDGVGEGIGEGPGIGASGRGIDEDRRYVDPGGGQLPGVNNCQPPSGPRESRSREARLRRSTPTVGLPPDGRHEHGLEIQLQYRVSIRDVHTRMRWVAEVRPERCFKVGPPGEGFGEGLDVGPTIDAAIDERVREAIEEFGGVPGDLGEGRPGGDGTPREPREPDAEEKAKKKEKFEKRREAEGGVPTETMSLRVPGRGPEGDVEVICRPAHCEWRIGVDRTTLEEYLSAAVTVRAEARVGFSTFGPLDRVEGFFFDDLRSRWGSSDSEAFAQMLGWLPQLNLRVTAVSSDDLGSDVSIDSTGGPISDGDTLRKALRKLCREDMFTWLEPISNASPRFGVSHDGALVSETVAALVQFLLAENPLDADDTDQLDRLTHLLRLAGETDGDGFEAPPTHVVDGDYVYLPMGLTQKMTELFESSTYPWG